MNALSNFTWMRGKQVTTLTNIIFLMVFFYKKYDRSLSKCMVMHDYKPNKCNNRICVR